MNQLIVGTLQEGGVHGEHRSMPAARPPAKVTACSSEMPTSKKRLRNSLPKPPRPGAALHGGGNGAGFRSPGPGSRVWPNSSEKRDFSRCRRWSHQSRRGRGRWWGPARRTGSPALISAWSSTGLLISLAVSGVTASSLMLWPIKGAVVGQSPYPRRWWCCKTGVSPAVSTCATT